MSNHKYKNLYSQSSSGIYGIFAIKIEVAGSNLPDLGLDSISNAAYEAARVIQAEIMAAAVAANPDARRTAIEERQAILDVFSSPHISPIFVEEIQNGYCPDWCCRHLPWFVVTTQVGRIKIGWRKRVISIEWEDTVRTATAEELFPGEDTTKGEKFIHAWGYEKAKEYVMAIVNSGITRPSTNTAHIPDEP